MDDILWWLPRLRAVVSKHQVGNALIDLAKLETYCPRQLVVGADRNVDGVDLGRLCRREVRPHHQQARDSRQRLRYRVFIDPIRVVCLRQWWLARLFLDKHQSESDSCRN